MDKEFAIFIAVLLATLGIYVYFANKEEEQWDKFALVHQCKKTAHVDSQVASTIGVDSKGQTVVGTATIPGKNAYLCDDGITYWR